MVQPEAQAETVVTRRERSLFNFIDSHLKELRWSAYGLGAVAFIVLVRKTRSTTKFKNVCNIPDHFVEKHYKLQGVVKQVTQDGALLVDHIPIMHLDMFPKGDLHSEQQYLCLQLAGLSMTPEGNKWLHTNTVRRHVWFTLLQRDSQVLDCHIKVKKSFWWYQSVNKALVRQGICAVKHFDSLPKSDSYNKLLRQLITLEDAASRKGRGLWREESKYRAWMRQKRSLFTFQWIKDKWQNIWRKKSQPPS
ncbi:protein C3orf33 homolog [Aplysia californica]|uniref:Protein C3orf33 homolog n=1 Tax=Aplysia californica TaxID=6500 RepID=A0ABM0JW43_APLCA|nr:protein C3orf33 homolog [Aplysia californica]XP_012940557.1 protein C3orf33 homolog [Aplysia californica]